MILLQTLYVGVGVQQFSACEYNNFPLTELADCTEATESDIPLKQIKQLLVDGSTLNALSGPLSSFELLHAGLVDALLTFLTPQATDR